MLLDSSVLVEYLRANPRAHALIDGESDGHFSVHLASHAEILVGAKNRADLRSLRAFLRRFQLVTPTEADLHQSIEFVAEHYLSHSVGWIDALIAATAIRLNLPVVTSNIKHFRGIDGVRLRQF